MPGEETLQHREDSSSEAEDDDDELEQVPNFDIDVTQLNPLSPEVISKQVRVFKRVDTPLGISSCLCTARF